MKSFNYAIAHETKYPKLQINTHIGFDEEDGEGIDGVKFSRELFELDNLNPNLITMYHNSMGGNVKEGYDILNAILNLDSRSKSVIAGFSFSTDGWLALAADEVEMTDYSTWMCHLPYNPKDADAEPDPTMMSFANKIATVIAGKSGKNGKKKKTVDEVLGMMTKKTYLNASEMYEHGLIDRVVITNKEISLVNLDKKQSKETHIKANKILNKLFLQQEKTPDMEYKDIANRLKCDPTEASVMAGIMNLENRIDSANKLVDEYKSKMETAQKAETESKLIISNKENEVLTLTNKVSGLEKDNADLQNKVKKLEDEAKEIENKAKADEQKAKEDAAAELIETFVNKGKINAEDKDSVEEWTKMAIENKSRAKILLESLPVNFRAPIALSDDENGSLKEPKSGEGNFTYWKNKNREHILLKNKQREEKIAASTK